MRKILSNKLCVFTVGIITSLPLPLRAQDDSGKNEFIDMDIAQLMNITITSVSKKTQKLADAAAAVYVITAEDIKHSGVTSLPQALTMAPGLQVAQISASKWSISSRGFSGFTSNKLLILIDGRSVYSPVYSGTFWDEHNVLLEDVARIEVIRGPGGTLWGANAVNGVINIITKKAEETQGVLFTAGGGSQESIFGGARIGEKLGESTYGRLSLSYSEREENSLHDEGMNAGDGWKNMQGSVRLDGEASRKATWTLQGDLYKNDEDQLVSPYWTITPPYLSSKYGSVEDEGASILGRYEYTISEDKTIIIQSYYDYSDRNDDFYQQTVNIYDLDLQYQMDIGKRNSLTMGSGFRQTVANFTDTGQVSIPDRTDELYSAFLQDEITVVPERLWFTVGTKWEYNDYTGSEWQPSARFLWKPAAHHSLWSSVARAVRTPSMVETEGTVLLAVIPVDYGVIQSNLLGNEYFTSEELIAYEIGYRWQSDLNVSVDLSVFYNDYDDIYSIAPVSPATGYDLEFVNGLEGRARGLEAVLGWTPMAWVSLELTYSYLDMSFEAKNGFNAATSAAVVDYVEDSSPRHQASLRSTLNIGNDVRLNLWFRYVDEIIVRNSKDLLGGGLAIDDYIVFDANIIWSVSENIEVILAGQNLLENHQLEYASEYVTPPTAIERGFYGKVTWKF